MAAFFQSCFYIAAAYFVLMPPRKFSSPGGQRQPKKRVSIKSQMLQIFELVNSGIVDVNVLIERTGAKKATITKALNEMRDKQPKRKSPAEDFLEGKISELKAKHRTMPPRKVAQKYQAVLLKISYLNQKKAMAFANGNAAAAQKIALTARPWLLLQRALEGVLPPGEILQAKHLVEKKLLE